MYKALRIYVFALLALTAIAWVALGTSGHLLHDPYLHNKLLAPELGDFGDFTSVSLRLNHFDEPRWLVRDGIGDPFPYPLPSIYCYLVFLRIFHYQHLLRALALYLIFAALSFTISAQLFSRHIQRISASKLPRIAVWVTLLTAYPIWVLINRGNIEAVLWVLVLLGVAAYVRERWLASAILWAAATAMKLSAGVLFALFLVKGRYWSFVIALAATAAFMLLTLAQVGPTIHQAALDSTKGASVLLDQFIPGRIATGFDESILGAVKQVLAVSFFVRHGHQVPPKVLPGTKTASSLYTILAPIAALLLYWFRLRRMPLLNQFIAYIVLFVVLPQVSYEYKLVYLYPVWGAFLLFLLTDVASGRVRISSSSIHTMLLSCAVVFACFSYVHVTIGTKVNAFGSQIKLLFLLTILVTVCRVPMPSSLFGDLQLSAARNSDELS